AIAVRNGYRSVNADASRLCVSGVLDLHAEYVLRRARTAGPSDEGVGACTRRLPRRPRGRRPAHGGPGRRSAAAGRALSRVHPYWYSRRMRGLPSSPRARRRLFRLGIVLAVVVAIAAILALVHGGKTPPASPGKNAAPAQSSRQSKHVSAADRRAI